MNPVFISGIGAVSPAGWGIAALRDAVAKDEPLPPQALERPGILGKLSVLRVPPPGTRPGFLAHSRLRRASSISHFAVSAVLEALGERANRPTAVIACVFSGCVNYSRRFYGEALHDPSTASPLLFPETVFNAPASHISAYLGTNAINYTLVGDVGTILTGAALGARWLLEGKAEQCVVVGTEEIDWLTADALRLFDRAKYLSEGAGAILLTTSPENALARLELITDECLYGTLGKAAAIARMRAELSPPSSEAVLLESSTDEGRLSRAERAAWQHWPGARLRPKRVLGEGLMASTAWQTLLGADLVATGRAHESLISIAGFHQHAVGARFGRISVYDFDDRSSTR